MKDVEIVIHEIEAKISFICRCGEKLLIDTWITDTTHIHCSKCGRHYILVPTISYALFPKMEMIGS